jgi:hypothetical protein
LWKSMLLIAIGLVCVSIYIYIIAWTALGHWAKSSVPPEQAAELVGAVKAAYFGMIPGFALILLGYGLAILKLSRKYAGPEAKASSLSSA